jgi:hypothetical protein
MKTSDPSPYCQIDIEVLQAHHIETGVMNKLQRVVPSGLWTFQTAQRDELTYFLVFNAKRVVAAFVSFEF